MMNGGEEFDGKAGPIEHERLVEPGGSCVDDGGVCMLCRVEKQMKGVGDGLTHGSPRWLYPTLCQGKATGDATDEGPWDAVDALGLEACAAR